MLRNDEYKMFIYFPKHIQELWEERAAIREFLGNMDRDQAEHLAFWEVRDIWLKEPAMLRPLKPLTRKEREMRNYLMRRYR